MRIFNDYGIIIKMPGGMKGVPVGNTNGYQNEDGYNQNGFFVRIYFHRLQERLSYPIGHLKVFFLFDKFAGCIYLSILFDIKHAAIGIFGDLFCKTRFNKFM